MVKQIWIYGTIVGIVSLCLIFTHLYLLESISKSPHKLVFVDESCYTRIDKEVDGLWQKLLLLNTAYKSAKSSNRTLLIITCPGESFARAAEIPSLCDLISADNNVVCKSLSSSQINKHVEQCLGEEYYGTRDIFVYSKIKNKRRVYICEGHFRQTSINSNLLVDLETRDHIKFNTLSHNIFEKGILNFMGSNGCKSLTNSALFWFPNSSSMTVVPPNGWTLVMGPGSRIAENQLYYNQKLLNVPDDYSSFDIEFIILHLLVQVRWLYGFNLSNAPELQDAMILVEGIRRQQGLTFCSSYLQSRATNLAYSPESKYEIWCDYQLKQYFEPLSYAFQSREKVKLYSPKLGQGDPNIAESQHKIKLPFNARKSSLSSIYYKFKLKELKFVTRPLFRYRCLALIGGILTAIIVWTAHYFNCHPIPILHRNSKS